ncbi:DNA-binding response regulator [Streptomyces sp. NPDC050485]|uniref:DNA-binding response regulator n=1 Tax=Streptomyces sp. NPDC050485 TaxID=3365617 RepID=UPI0037A4CC5A
MSITEGETRLGRDAETIGVFVLARGALPRSGIVAMISSRPGMRVLGEAENAAAIAPGRTECPDVLVLLLPAGDRAGMESLREIRRLFYDCPVLLVVGGLAAGGAQRALAADAAGVISDASSADVLIDSIRRLQAGERVVGPDVAVLGSAHCPNPLTPRENEILGLAAEGESPEETARHLHLSAGTVRNHLLSAVQKAGARNRLDAVRIARRKGWL